MEPFFHSDDPMATISGAFFPNEDLQSLALGNSTTAGMGGSQVGHYTEARSPLEHISVNPVAPRFAHIDIYQYHNRLR